MVEILVPIALFATIFGIVFIAVTAKNNERLALIDKGLDASIFKDANNLHGRYVALKLGLLAIGVALGLIVGNILEEVGMNDEVAYFAMIFLFGGLSLLVYYGIMRKIKPEEKE